MYGAATGIFYLFIFFKHKVIHHFFLADGQYQCTHAFLHSLHYGENQGTFSNYSLHTLPLHFHSVCTFSQRIRHIKCHPRAIRLWVEVAYKTLPQRACTDDSLLTWCNTLRCASHVRCKPWWSTRADDDSWNFCKRVSVTNRLHCVSKNSRRVFILGEGG